VAKGDRLLARLRREERVLKAYIRDVTASKRAKLREIRREIARILAERG
jgi:ribosomal protein L29